ncbi:MAG: sensor histidine kinase [Clostridiales bacterium]|nr:sensor histidine kinase [Clostridiales bacterium]
MEKRRGDQPGPLRRHRSFRSKLLFSFLSLSIIPVIALTLYSSSRIVNTAQDNIDSLIGNNLEMISRNLTVTLAAYSDILYQLYTSDDVVDLVNGINAGKDVALRRNQLLRTLRAACYFRPYIQGITVLLPSGDTVFYDKLTGSATQNAWINCYPVPQDDLLAAVSADNRTHMLQTAFAAFINRQSVYLFHMAHRIINYRDIVAQCGVVILSIDSRLLMETIGYDSSDSGGENLLLDADGTVLASTHEDQIGARFADPQADALAMAQTTLTGDLHAYSAVNGDYGWRILRVLSQSLIRSRIFGQQSWFILALVLISAALAAAVFVFTSRMNRSVQTIVRAMDAAGRGELDTRLSLPASAPDEMCLIATDFNWMLEQLGAMIDEVRRANDSQRQAELAAVEAQLNPHFLYNTLDTINWMAINREQYEISNCISALGGILRYAIDRADRRVTVREELGWVEKYVYLQRTRLKNEFSFRAEVDPQALECRVRKLLFQPYVENAIIHGFEGARGTSELRLTVRREGDWLRIVIGDNGKGMTEQAIQEAFGEPADTPPDRRSHIGIRNAMARLEMYYHGQATLAVASAPGQGTTVTLCVPLEGEEKLPCES